MTPIRFVYQLDLRMSLRNDTYLGERIERLDGRDPVELGEEVLGGWVIVERLVIARRVVQPEVWLEHGQRERCGELLEAVNGQLQWNVRRLFVFTCVQERVERETNLDLSDEASSRPLTD